VGKQLPEAGVLFKGGGWSIFGSAVILLIRLMKLHLQFITYEEKQLLNCPKYSVSQYLEYEKVEGNPYSFSRHALFRMALTVSNVCRKSLTPSEKQIRFR
jgi:hypothetical protein